MRPTFGGTLRCRYAQLSCRAGLRATRERRSAGRRGTPVAPPAGALCGGRGLPAPTAPPGAVATLLCAPCSPAHCCAGPPSPPTQRARRPAARSQPGAGRKGRASAIARAVTPPCTCPALIRLLHIARPWAPAAGGARSVAPRRPGQRPGPRRRPRGRRPGGSLPRSPQEKRGPAWPRSVPRRSRREACALPRAARPRRPRGRPSASLRAPPPAGGLAGACQAPAATPLAMLGAEEAPARGSAPASAGRLRRGFASGPGRPRGASRWRSPRLPGGFAWPLSTGVRVCPLVPLSSSACSPSPRRRSARAGRLWRCCGGGSPSRGCRSRPAWRRRPGGRPSSASGCRWWRRRCPAPPWRAPAGSGGWSRAWHDFCYDVTRVTPGPITAPLRMLQAGSALLVFMLVQQLEYVPAEPRPAPAVSILESILLPRRPVAALEGGRGRRGIAGQGALADLGRSAPGRTPPRRCSAGPSRGLGLVTRATARVAGLTWSKSRHRTPVCPPVNNGRIVPA